MKRYILLIPILFLTTNVSAQNDDQFSDPEQRQKEKFQQEREQARKSWTESEAEYYRETAPHEVDDPTYFEEDHPLEEKPLDESLLK